ncbi:hypothetical protein FAES_3663 [Fibrella aestuarina BUZ 2]|uniref:HTH cro/C1-type domain-containing protein n=1 Tax=Fibrella aestuarina BUZ 2 TaxID=1166018 RepID=I0KC17_9BACT|nr:helix-turn-helix transcriptional regulator [Fibrella aestuarina]CCH01670.1 hypothetical protein FAES_3663 [Fibrella aestuarina BUZ 2]
METAVEVSTLATRVKELRRLLGKSAETFADETGIGLGALRHIEQGRTLNPGINVVEQVCTRYGVSEKWLIRNMGPVFDAPDKMEAQLSETLSKLNQAYQQLDQVQAEVAGKETIIQGLLALSGAKPTRPTQTKQRLGKGNDVVHSPLQRGRFGPNFSQLGHVGGYIAR